MAAIANITVKKKDGTTDVVWTGIQGQGGDSAPARFASNTVGTAIAHRPTLQILSRDNGPKTARHFEGVFRYPNLVTDASAITKVDGQAVASFSFVLPKGMTDAQRGEAAYQFGNLLASSLVKASFDEGNAPT
jgi:hypothetical protein